MYFRGYGLETLISNAGAAVAAPVIAPMIAYEVGGSHRAPAADSIMDPIVAAEIAAQPRDISVANMQSGSQTNMPGGGTSLPGGGGGGGGDDGGGSGWQGMTQAEFGSFCVQAGGTMQGSVCVEPSGNKWVLDANGVMQRYSDGYVDRGYVDRGYDINDIDNWNKPKSNGTSMSGTTIAIVAGVGLLGLFLLLK